MAEQFDDEIVQNFPPSWYGRDELNGGKVECYRPTPFKQGSLVNSNHSREAPFEPADSTFRINVGWGIIRKQGTVEL